MVWYNSIGASDGDDLIFAIALRQWPYRTGLWQRRPGDLQRAVKGPEAETTPIGVGFLFL